MYELFIIVRFPFVFTRLFFPISDLCDSWLDRGTFASAIASSGRGGFYFHVFDKLRFPKRFSSVWQEEKIRMGDTVNRNNFRWSIGNPKGATQ